MSRVVMFVYNDVRRDSRVLREAATLARAGHRVTVIGRTRDLASRIVERETLGGFDVLRIPVPSGWRTGWTLLRRPWHMGTWVRARCTRGLRAGGAGIGHVVIGLAIGVVAVLWTVVGAPIHLLLGRRLWGEGSILEWLVLWRFGIRGWAHSAAAAAPPADIYHGHDLTALPAAAEAAKIYSALLVYDSHEIFLESGPNPTRPRWARAWLSRLERRWSARAAALVTVNDVLASELGRRLKPRRTVVVHNCPARWDPPSDMKDALRSAVGVPPGTPIALYHGGFSAQRGLTQFAESILEPGLESIHAVFLGYGRGRPEVDRLAADPRFAGRVHVLDPVAPEVLVPFISTTDVDVMVNQPAELNTFLSTPNKLFESLAAGVPVVSSDFPARRRIVIDDPDGPLGAVCDPTDRGAIATAIRGIIELDPAARADLRRRCLRAAHERWNWETESAKLLALYAELLGPAPG